MLKAIIILVYSTALNTAFAVNGGYVNFNVGGARPTNGTYSYIFPHLDMTGEIVFHQTDAHPLSLRVLLGIDRFRAEVGGSEPEVRYRPLNANFVYYATYPDEEIPGIFLTGGIGLYRRRVEAPLVPETDSDWQGGLNGGIGFLIGIGHGPAARLELLYHSVPGEGPGSFVTYSIGLLVWGWQSRSSVPTNEQVEPTAGSVASDRNSRGTDRRGLPRRWP